MIHIKSRGDIDIMRSNGGYLAKIFDLIHPYIIPGAKVHSLASLVENYMNDCGAMPSFKGYKGFPASICVSIDCELIHGIPAGQILREGQIVSIDIGFYRDGFHVDAARTWPVGKVSPISQHLIWSVNTILQEAIEFIHPNIRLGNLSHRIEQAAIMRHYDVVRGYGGHGIGVGLHEDPHIPNYGEKGKGPILKEGMVLALEPMIMAGNPDVEVLSDGWTIVSKDRRLNAHTEDTVVVTSGGCEILTRV